MLGQRDLGICHTVLQVITWIDKLLSSEGLMNSVMIIMLMFSVFRINLKIYYFLFRLPLLSCWYLSLRKLSAASRSVSIEPLKAEH